MRIEYKRMKKKPINLTVDRKTRKKLDDLAKRDKRSLSNEVTSLIDKEWEERQKQYDKTPVRLAA